MSGGAEESCEGVEGALEPGLDEPAVMSTVEPEFDEQVAVQLLLL